MKTDSRVKHDDKTEKHFPVRQIRFICKHAGKPRIRNRGIRPVQAYMPCKYPMSLRLKLDVNSEHYKIKCKFMK